jgi:hypothetical protein
VTYNCIVQRTEERQQRKKVRKAEKEQINQRIENHRAKYEESLKENVFEKSHP